MYNSSVKYSENEKNVLVGRFVCENKEEDLTKKEESLANLEKE